MQRRVHSRRITLIVIMAVAAMMLALLPTGSAGAKPDKPPKVDFWLTIVHNNDGESQVIDAGSGLESGRV